jgi:hypothetical protein
MLIRHLKKRKWRYVLIIFLLGAYSFYLFKFKLLEYSSTASFLVNDNNIVSPLSLDLKDQQDRSTNSNFNRIYELINSAATQKHLIEKFGLISHYEIDSTKEFAYQKAVEKIRTNITVSKSPFNTISVTVHDRYRYLAADMANEIVDFLETLNESLYINNMKNKIQISQAYVDQLKKDNIQKSIAIDSLIQKLNKLFLLKNGDDKSKYDLLSNQQTLSTIVNNFQNSTNELINSEKLYNLSLQALNFKSYPVITIIRMAMPAPRSIALTSLLLSIGIMFSSAFLLILQAYLFIHNKDFFEMIINEKPE